MDEVRTVTERAELDYRYEFRADETAEIIACFRAHGFAIARQLASPEIVADLRDAVDEVLGAEPLARADNRTTPEFVERSRKATRLLDAEPYLALNRQLFATDELTIHRSFAVLKNAGSGPVAWHRDFHHVVATRPREPDEFLDAGDHGFRALWYLDGSYPSEGGLWLIPDSHRQDWPGLPGFEFTAGRKSFHRVGSPAVDYCGFDCPQMLPLHVDPGDLVIYDLRTYHAAAPQPTGLRRACAVILRPRDPPIAVPWPQTEATRQFLAGLPPDYARFVHNYTSVDYAWTVEATEG